MAASAGFGPGWMSAPTQHPCPRRPGDAPGSDLPPPRTAAAFPAACRRHLPGGERRGRGGDARSLSGGGLPGTTKFPRPPRPRPAAPAPPGPAASRAGGWGCNGGVPGAAPAASARLTPARRGGRSLHAPPPRLPGGRRAARRARAQPPPGDASRRLLLRAGPQRRRRRLDGAGGRGRRAGGGG